MERCEMGMVLMEHHRNEVILNQAKMELIVMFMTRMECFGQAK